MNDRTQHWEDVYTAKADTSVSWFEDSPRLSVDLILAATSKRGAAIDIGGGASRLPDALLDAGFAHVASLDLSEAALRVSQARLGPQAKQVNWIVADVTKWTPPRKYDVWHDRAALHFLTDKAGQERYARAINSALASGGVAIIGTFAPGGPERCSGLPVVRHDSASLSALLGPSFELRGEVRHEHVTPGGATQQFQFSIFQKL